LSVSFYFNISVPGVDRLSFYRKYESAVIFSVTDFYIYLILMENRCWQ